MGITGLLPFVEKASRKCNIGDFRNCTVAIDTYCWLHKGAFACADKLIRGEHTDVYTHYCLKYVNMILSKNIKPILVFDGRHLPAKALTEDKRRESRKLAKKRAAELLRLDKFEEAMSFMRRGVDVTHEMALNLIKECRKRNIDCIVAPYEADAQLAYLNLQNIADIIITEDSDLILFGCSKVLFKMDLAGNGSLVETCKLPLVMKCPIEKYSFNKFRQMCIMAGCDYLPSLPSIGLAKARQFVNTTQDPNISNALRKLPSFFNKSTLVVTDEYCQNFLKAEATFKHQLVYDPLKRKMVPLLSLESEGTDEKYCTNAGELLKAEVAFQLAIGNLDPFTLKKMDDWDPDNREINTHGVKWNGSIQVNIDSRPSIWSPEYGTKMKQKDTNKRCRDMPAAIDINQARPIAKKIVNIVSPILEDLQNSLTIEQLSSMYRQEPTAKKRRIVVEETQSLTEDIVEVKTPTKSRNPFVVHISDNAAKKLPHTDNISPPLLRPVIVDDSQYPEEIIKTPTKMKNHLLNNTDNDKFQNNPNGKENIESPSKYYIPNKEPSPILEIKGRNFKKFVESTSYSVLRKMSKFDRTLIDSGNTIESRYFGTSSSTSVMNNSHNLSSEYDSACVLDDVGTKATQKLLDAVEDDRTSLSHNETIRNRILTEDQFDWSEPTQHHNDLNINVVNIYDSSYLEDHDKLTDLVTPTTSQESQCSSEVEQSQSSVSLSSEGLSKTSHSESTSKSNQSSAIQKKTCKRPGLQKRSSTLSSQSSQSLLTMFGFMKRSPMKH